MGPCVPDEAAIFPDCVVTGVLRSNCDDEEDDDDDESPAPLLLLVLALSRCFVNRVLAASVGVARAELGGL